MSEASATGRRPGVFSRIFNALTGDAAPEGVDPALHRRALWIAFVFTAIPYTAYFLLTLPAYFPLPEAVGNLLYGVGRPLGFIYYVPTISGGHMWQALLLPIFIYAIVLKARGARIPLATLDLAVCALVGYVLHMTLPTKYFELPLALLAMFALMTFRGHLTARVARFMAAVSFSLWLLLEVSRLVVLYGSLHGLDWTVGVSFAEFQVFSILWLPLSIALPIALMAKPHTPQLRPLAEKSWQLTSVLLLTVVLATASYILNLTTQMKVLSEGVFWMVGVTILVMLLWLYKTGKGSRELLTFLGLALGGFVVMQSVLPYMPMSYGLRLSLIIVLAAVAALVLSTGKPLRQTNLWAAGTLVIGVVAAAFWHGYMYERFIERYDLQWRTDPGEFVKTALALLVALALFIVPLLLAWWFVKPKEIEALMPWGKQPPAASRQSSAGETPD